MMLNNSQLEYLGLKTNGELLSIIQHLCESIPGNTEEIEDMMQDDNAKYAPMQEPSPPIL